MSEPLSKADTGKKTRSKRARVHKSTVITQQVHGPQCRARHPLSTKQVSSPPAASAPDSDSDLPDSPALHPFSSCSRPASPIRRHATTGMYLTPNSFVSAPLLMTRPRFLVHRHTTRGTTVISCSVGTRIRAFFFSLCITRVW